MKRECGGEEFADKITFGGSINVCDGDKWNVGASVDVSEGHDITVQASHQPKDDLMMFGSFNVALPQSAENFSTLALGASMKHMGWKTNIMASAKLPYSMTEEGKKEATDFKFKGLMGMPGFL